MMDDRPSGAKASFVIARRCGEFQFSQEHPFRPDRQTSVYEMCRRRGLLDGAGISVVEIENAEDRVLERFHTKDYIEALRRADRGDDVDLDMIHHGIGPAENPVFEGVFEFSALSATASLTAARLVADSGGSAFNPCGGFHHAYPDRAAGFCYVNDVAIAIDELRKRGRRVAYVDIDAHHGDAVQHAYFGDRSVLTVSMHESGKTLFPWGGFDWEVGEGDAMGYNINVPLEPGTDDDNFLRLFNDIVMDALRIFDPEVIVGQFGTDMLSTDPLTHLRLTNNGYIEAVEILHGEFPAIVALGGGGYNQQDVTKSWTLLWAELAGKGIEQSGYGGALGGVFLGDSSIEDSDLRDMRIYLSGPEKERLEHYTQDMISNYRRGILPLLQDRNR